MNSSNRMAHLTGHSVQMPLSWALNLGGLPMASPQQFDRQDLLALQAQATGNTMVHHQGVLPIYMQQTTAMQPATPQQVWNSLPYSNPSGNHARALAPNGQTQATLEQNQTFAQPNRGMTPQHDPRGQQSQLQQGYGSHSVTYGAPSGGSRPPTLSHYDGSLPYAQSSPVAARVLSNAVPVQRPRAVGSQQTAGIATNGFPATAGRQSPALPLHKTSQDVSQMASSPRVLQQVYTPPWAERTYLVRQPVLLRTNILAHPASQDPLSIRQSINVSGNRSGLSQQSSMQCELSNHALQQQLYTNNRRGLGDHFPMDMANHFGSGTQGFGPSDAVPGDSSTLSSGNPTLDKHGQFCRTASVAPQDNYTDLTLPPGRSQASSNDAAEVVCAQPPGNAAYPEPHQANIQQLLAISLPNHQQQTLSTLPAVTMSINPQIFNALGANPTNETSRSMSVQEASARSNVSRSSQESAHLSQQTPSPGSSHPPTAPEMVPIPHVATTSGTSPTNSARANAEMYFAQKRQEQQQWQQIPAPVPGQTPFPMHISHHPVYTRKISNQHPTNNSSSDGGAKRRKRNPEEVQGEPEHKNPRTEGAHPAKQRVPQPSAPSYNGKSSVSPAPQLPTTSTQYEADVRAGRRMVEQPSILSNTCQERPIFNSSNRSRRASPLASLAHYEVQQASNRSGRAKVSTSPGHYEPQQTPTTTPSTANTTPADTTNGTVPSTPKITRSGPSIKRHAGFNTTLHPAAPEPDQWIPEGYTPVSGRLAAEKTATTYAPTPNSQTRKPVSAMQTHELDLFTHLGNFNRTRENLAAHPATPPAAPASSWDTSFRSMRGLEGKSRGSIEAQMRAQKFAGMEAGGDERAGRALGTLVRMGVLWRPEEYTRVGREWVGSEGWDAEQVGLDRSVGSEGDGGEEGEEVYQGEGDYQGKGKCEGGGDGEGEDGFEEVSG